MKTQKCLLAIAANVFVIMGVLAAGCSGGGDVQLTGKVEAKEWGNTAFRLTRDASGAKVACGSVHGGIAMCVAIIPGKDQSGGVLAAAACSDPTDGWCGFTLSPEACPFQDNADGTQDYNCAATPCLSAADCNDKDSSTQDLCINDGQVNGICYHPGLACTVGSGACTNAGVYEKDSAGAQICNVSPKPKGTEVCTKPGQTPVDEDCDGSTDEENAGGCTYFYTDADSDGHGAGAAKCLCAAAGLYTAVTPDDCNDKDATIYPGAPEICDGKDNDCDGGTDEPFTNLTKACDNGLLGECFATGTYVCSADHKSTACNASGKTPQQESCNNLDDNCDGNTDEGCDADGDGWCTTAMAVSNPPPKVCPHGGGDCNDNDPAINPGAKEVCDGKDNNCNGLTDEGFNVGDGCMNGLLGACAASGKIVCDANGDGKASCNAPMPKPATEVCGDNIDNDCDGKTDEENASGCMKFWTDADKDSYGTGAAKCLCAATGLYTAAIAGDCNDNDATINPGAPEICDGVDNNCNGLTDEGCDKDSDGWCDSSMTVIGTPAVCPHGGGDCNDNDPTIHPGATEVCNGIDDNCNGITDEVPGGAAGSVCNPAISPTQIACGQTVNVNTSTDKNTANVFKFWELPGYAPLKSDGKEEAFKPMATSGTWTFSCMIDTSKTTLTKTKLRVVLLSSMSATPDKDADGDGVNETGSTKMVEKVTFSSVTGAVGENVWTYVDTAAASPAFVGTCTLTCSP